MNPWISEFLSLVYPENCLICSEPLDGEHSIICPLCEERLPLITTNACRLCSRPIGPDGKIICSECGGLKRHFSSCIAAGMYDGVLRELVHQFKYGKNRDILGVLGSLLTNACESRLQKDNIDCIVPVPMHWFQRLKRGFNQSALLAEFAAGRLKKPIRRFALIKKRFTGRQVEKDRAQRINLIKGSIAILNKSAIIGKRILLVDDVYTTGSTVNECAKILIENGAREVTVVVLARG